MSDWLFYLAVPAIMLSFAAIGGGLLISYAAIRLLLPVLAPEKSHLASLYFGYFWMGIVLGIAGYSIAELGYQLRFWDAPGIWGQPGKSSTVWGRLQYVLALSGFAAGLVLNAALERRARSHARSARIQVTAWAALLLIATLLLSAWHGWQTLG